MKTNDKDLLRLLGATGLRIVLIVVLILGLVVGASLALGNKISWWTFVVGYGVISIISWVVFKRFLKKIEEKPTQNSKTPDDEITSDGKVASYAYFILGIILFALGIALFLFFRVKQKIEDSAITWKDFEQAWFWKNWYWIIPILVVAMIYRIWFWKKKPIGAKQFTWLGWALGAIGFICLYAFVIRPKQLDSEAGYVAKRAEHDLKMRMPYTQKQQPTTTVQVVSGTLPYGDYPAFPTPSCEVLWGNQVGSFYPTEIGKTLSLRLRYGENNELHCDLIIRRTAEGVWTEVHNNTTGGQTGIYTATLLSDNGGFGYSSAPTIDGFLSMAHK